MNSESFAGVWHTSLFSIYLNLCNAKSYNSVLID